MEPFQHSITPHMWSYLVHMCGGSKHVSTFQFEGMKFKFIDSIKECSCDKSYKTNKKKKEKIYNYHLYLLWKGFFFIRKNKMLMV